MEGMNFGSSLAAARKEKEMTQEQLASRLGVTPQAVSKWERGAGYPDLELLYYLCDLLDCSADSLIGRKGYKDRLTEDNDSTKERQLLDNVLAEPLVLEAGSAFLELLSEEQKLQFPGIHALRDRLAKKYGILLPVLRIRDNPEIGHCEYRILAYDEVLWSHTPKSMEGITFDNLCEDLERTVIESFDKIVNRQMIQLLVSNAAKKYPFAVNGVIPEKIELSILQKVLSGIVVRRKPIRNLIKILEVLEEEIKNTMEADRLTEAVLSRLAL